MAADKRYSLNLNATDSAMANTSLELRSPADITARPRYKAVIDPIANPFKRIIRHYQLRVPIQCSIKSCRQPHNEGFLVELSDGDETNIGHVCGRKYFGESFAIGVEDYRREILIPELRKRIVLSKDRVRSFRPRVTQMCEEEETGPGRQKRNFRRLFPQLTKVLSQRAARGQVTVTQPRRRSQQEVEQLMAMNPRTPREQFEFEDMPVGQLRGLQSFDENLRELLHTKLREPMERLLNENVYAMPLDQLIATDLWLGSLDEVLARAERVLSDTRNFYSEGNIEVLRHLDMPNDERKKLIFAKLQELERRDPRDIIQEKSEKPLNRRERRRLKFEQ